MFSFFGLLAILEENLLFEESQAKKIVILGKENVEIKKEIDILEADYQSKQKSIEELEEAQKNYQTLMLFSRRPDGEFLKVLQIHHWRTTPTTEEAITRARLKSALKAEP